MSFYISDEDLTETVVDTNEDMDDRIYALRSLQRRVTGFTTVVLSSHVEQFCKDHKEKTDADN